MGRYHREATGQDAEKSSMSGLISVTLKPGMTAVAWTDVSEDGVRLLSVEAKVTVLAIDDDSVTLAIEQTEIQDND